MTNLSGNGTFGFPQGWLCFRCQKVNAPSVKQCFCNQYGDQPVKEEIRPSMEEEWRKTMLLDKRPIFCKHLNLLREGCLICKSELGDAGTL